MASNENQSHHNNAPVQGDPICLLLKLLSPQENPQEPPRSNTPPPSQSNQNPSRNPLAIAQEPTWSFPADLPSSNETLPQDNTPSQGQQRDPSRNRSADRTENPSGPSLRSTRAESVVSEDSDRAENPFEARRLAGLPAAADTVRRSIAEVSTTPRPAPTQTDSTNDDPRPKNESRRPDRREHISTSIQASGHAVPRQQRNRPRPHSPPTPSAIGPVYTLSTRFPPAADPMANPPPRNPHPNGNEPRPSRNTVVSNPPQPSQSIVVNPTVLRRPVYDAVQARPSPPQITDQPAPRPAAQPAPRPAAEPVTLYKAAETRRKRPRNQWELRYPPEKYLPPPGTYVRQSDLEAGGYGIQLNRPKCPRCGQSKKDLNGNVHPFYRECKNTCQWCHQDAHFAMPCPRIYASERWWERNAPLPRNCTEYPAYLQLKPGPEEEKMLAKYDFATFSKTGDFTLKPRKAWPTQYTPASSSQAVKRGPQDQDSQQSKRIRSTQSFHRPPQPASYQHPMHSPAMHHPAPYPAPYHGPSPISPYQQHYPPPYYLQGYPPYYPQNYPQNYPPHQAGNGPPYYSQPFPRPYPPPQHQDQAHPQNGYQQEAHPNGGSFSAQPPSVLSASTRPSSGQHRSPWPMSIYTPEYTQLPSRQDPERPRRREDHGLEQLHEPRIQQTAQAPPRADASGYFASWPPRETRPARSHPHPRNARSGNMPTQRELFPHKLTPPNPPSTSTSHPQEPGPQHRAGPEDFPLAGSRYSDADFSSADPRRSSRN